MVSKLRKRRQERKQEHKEKQKESNSREDSDSGSKAEITLQQRDNTEKHKISWEKRKQKVNLCRRQKYYNLPGQRASKSEYY